MNLPTDVDFVLLVPPSHHYAKIAGERKSITIQVEPFAVEPIWCDIKEIQASIPERRPIVIGDPKLPDDGSWRFRLGWYR